MYLCIYHYLIIVVLVITMIILDVFMMIITNLDNSSNNIKMIIIINYFYTMNEFIQSDLSLQLIKLNAVSRRFANISRNCIASYRNWYRNRIAKTIPLEPKWC